MSAKCSSCDAPIVWAVSAKTGKRIPIDAAPVADGNIVLSGTLRVLVAHVYGPGQLSPAGHAHYKSHFATCPNAGQHRKPKEPRP